MSGAKLSERERPHGIGWVRLKVPVQLTLVAVALLVSGCANTLTNVRTSDEDPFESSNRAIYAFNQKVDHAVARPIAQFYARAVPTAVRTGVHNVLTNVNLPVVLGNDLLQGDLRRASQTIGRLSLNSTLGLGGFIDVASKLRIPDHDTDFGITLGTWGIGEGPYLVVPLLGPAPPRDLSGKVVDVALDPLTYVSFHGKIYVDVAIGTLGVIDLRSRNIETLENIERTSIDPYAATRSLYLQYRAAAVRKGGPSDESLPSF